MKFNDFNLTQLRSVSDGGRWIRWILVYPCVFNSLVPILSPTVTRSYPQIAAAVATKWVQQSGSDRIHRSSGFNKSLCDAMRYDTRRLIDVRPTVEAASGYRSATEGKRVQHSCRSVLAHQGSRSPGDMIYTVLYSNILTVFPVAGGTGIFESGNGKKCQNTPNSVWKVHLRLR